MQPNAEELTRAERNKAIYADIATLYRQGRTKDEVGALARERWGDDLPEKKLTSLVARVGRSNKPKKDTYRLWYFPNLAKEDLQNMNYLELTNLQRGWRAVLEKQAWLNKGMLPADKNKLLMLALIHSPDEREQFIKEDLQTILYDFELVMPQEGRPAYWFNQYMEDECKRLQKVIRTKVVAGQKSAEARKKKDALEQFTGYETEA